MAQRISNRRKSSEEYVEGQIEKRTFTDKVEYSIQGRGRSTKIIVFKSQLCPQRSNLSTGFNIKREMRVKSKSKRVGNTNKFIRIGKRHGCYQHRKTSQKVDRNKENVKLIKCEIPHQQSEKNEFQRRSTRSSGVLMPVNDVQNNKSETDILQQMKSVQVIIEHYSESEETEIVHSIKSSSINDKIKKIKKADKKNNEVNKRCTRSQSLKTKRISMRNAFRKKPKVLKNKNGRKNTSLLK